jgi:hypothetical protein
MSLSIAGRAALSALLVSAGLLSEAAVARGSRKPREASPATPSRKSVLKRLVSVDQVSANSLMEDEESSARFAFLLGEQFSHHLLFSEAFVTTPLVANEAQFELDVSLIAFEAVSSKGVKFGFSPAKNFLPIGLEFSIQAQSLLATFRIVARDPLTNRSVGSVLATGTMTDKKKFFSVRYLDFINASFE